MTDEPKLYTQQEMDDVLEWRNAAIDQLSREVSSLRAVADRALGNYDAARTVLRAVEKDRDAARELANQLANDLMSTANPAAALVCRNHGISAYEARDWR